MGSYIRLAGRILIYGASDELTAPAEPGCQDDDNWSAHVKKVTSYWVDTSDAARKLDDDHTPAKTQRRIVIPEDLDLLNVLNAGRNDLMTGLVEFGDTGLDKLGAPGSGSGGHPDDSRLEGIGNMGKFASLAQNLGASFGLRGEGRVAGIFRSDSDLSVDKTGLSKDDGRMGD